MVCKLLQKIIEELEKIASKMPEVAKLSPIDDQLPADNQQSPLELVIASKTNNDAAYKLRTLLIGALDGQSAIGSEMLMRFVRHVVKGVFSRLSLK